MLQNSQKIEERGLRKFFQNRSSIQMTSQAFLLFQDAEHPIAGPRELINSLSMPNKQIGIDARRETHSWIPTSNDADSKELKSQHFLTIYAALPQSMVLIRRKPQTAI